MSWLNKFARFCKESEKNINFEKAKKIISWHKMLNVGLGFPFLVIFSLVQLFSIANTFNIISFQLNETKWERVCFSVSFFLLVVTSICYVLSLVLSVEEAFFEMKKLEKPLKDNLCKLIVFILIVKPKAQLC